MLAEKELKTYINHLYNKQWKNEEERVLTSWYLENIRSSIAESRAMFEPLNQQPTEKLDQKIKATMDQLKSHSLYLELLTLEQKVIKEKIAKKKYYKKVIEKTQLLEQEYFNAQVSCWNKNIKN